MIESISLAEEYARANKVVGEFLHPRIEDPRVEVRLYFNEHHALEEIAKGLIKMYPNREVISAFEDQGPQINPLLKGISREGRKVNRGKTGEIGLDPKDLLFAMAEDDPITGKLFDNDEIRKKLVEAKTFKLKVSHYAYRRLSTFKPDNPYAILVIPMKKDLALAFLSPRAKVPSLINGGFQPRADFLEVVKEAFQKLEEDQKKVEEFESQFPEAKLNLGNRLYDRAVLSFKGFDGSAICDLLVKNHGLDPKLIDTASPCRWLPDDQMNWLVHQGLTLEEIRGLVVLDLSILDTDLDNKLKNSITELSSLQEG